MNVKSYVPSELEMIYAILIQLAKKKTTIFYSELGNHIGLKPGNYLGFKLGSILDQINRDEHKHGKPMLSAVVITKQNGIPAPGFFDLAKELKGFSGDKIDFWNHELKDVYNAWA